MSVLDFSDAEQQRSFECIPPGHYCKVRMELKPGQASLPNHPVPEDAGLFTRPQSLDSDVLMLRYDLTVLCGPWAKQKVFGQFIIAGGNLENGISKGWLISKPMIRAILDSARGLDPNDESPEAKAKRAMNAFSDLHGLEFGIKVGVERDATGQYPDRNAIDRIVVPGDPRYAELGAEKEVEPDPHARVRVRKQQGGNGRAQEPSWQGQRTPQRATATPNQWAQPARPQMQAQQSSSAPAQSGAGPKWLQEGKA